ncbi:MAG: lytic transglycosylase domain-containing protein [Prevotellaceae bacterium]|nr:lytic transglycosylase domain-containing protein [Prevotellaceae bacterium]
MKKIVAIILSAIFGCAIFLHAENMKDIVEYAATMNDTTDDSVYIERLNKLNTTMEMTYNKDVRAKIERYANRQQATVSYVLGASKYYFPIFEKALKENDMPVELRYLPAIESTLKPKAISRRGAAGLWQMKAITAREQGLKINSLVDERLDVYKSTESALHYLRFLYKFFDDNWTLAIAAYNCGPTAISRAIRRANGSNDFWKIRKFLPKETRDYVPTFIAMVYIMNYYQEHGITPDDTDLPSTCDRIMTSHNISLRQISDYCNWDYTYLKKLNPRYRTELIPGEKEPSPICLPREDMEFFIAKEDSICKFNTDKYFKKGKVSTRHKRWRRRR